ncbi:MULTISPECIES: mechanosensitive ion channel family protein [unclassified Nodularia (in: cyanobacteria)]|uniref:mechanosensitive ion channel family protein n=1 Tax=unclassified Nodularia (in: cyanobacteria) TaxID=2656917 RepID=UPI0018822056|nr:MULTISPECIES: mechanosensitive ion channel family protein [unclassified Nodularia (in: cyanobacteria)]MBE9198556.1 mechanosensitive ion channel family protein [Nodularia sp. LEGE 06071]MCC2693592.1 mechanosensitive ion channel family protein [Nodularia sp. LEGE 04288]
MPFSMIYNISLFAQLLDDNGIAERLLTDITVNKILKALISVFIAYGISVSIQSFVNWLSERVPRLFRLTIKQSVPFWKGLILIITVVYLLNLFLNLSQRNLLAFTGTIAVALGFAFKDYVSSIIAGVVTLFEAPYRVGDRIRIGEHYGEVIGYGLRGLRLQTPDDNTVTIPHNKTWTDAISNANSGQLEAQVVTEFYLDHEVDTEKVIQILYQTAYSSRYTQLKLPVVVIMEELPWCTQFKLKSYPMDARDEFIYKTDLIRQAKQAFTKHQLSYPNKIGQVTSQTMFENN